MTKDTLLAYISSLSFLSSSKKETLTNRLQKNQLSNPQKEKLMVLLADFKTAYEKIKHDKEKNLEGTLKN